jgi:hypothetical protein
MYRTAVAMRLIAGQTRLLLVVALAASTTVAPICTPVAKSASPAARIAKTHSCCCGTEDGACCGMACCMRQQSKQLPTTPLSRGSAGLDGLQSVILYLHLSACGIDATECIRFSQSCHVDFCGALAAATLQSQHVRIQT